MVMMMKTAMTELISEMIVTEQRKAVFLYTNSGEPLCKCNHLKMMISSGKKEGDDDLLIKSLFVNYNSSIIYVCANRVSSG